MAAAKAPGPLPLDFGGPAAHPFEPFPRTALDATVPERFEAMAARHATRPAIADGTVSLNYSEVQERANRLARAMLGAQGAANAPIALLLGHDAYFPIAMMAALKTGRPYLPLDATFPVERNRHILSHAGASLIVTDAAHLGLAGELAAQGVPIIDIASQTVHASGPLDVPASFDGLAYIIYTSGTTGAPKGVYQSQRNLLHDVMQYTNSVHLAAEDRLTMLYSGSVSGAIRDIYGALLNGACLNVLSPRALGMRGLAEAIQRLAITVYHSVPVVFRQLTAALAPEARLDSVRLVYLAGDRLDWDDARAFQRHFPPGSKLYTGIGSTENATIFRQWFIDHNTPIGSGRLPVGRAIPERTVSLTGDDGRVVPPGEVGEIVVSSRYMALGYWRAEDLTRTAFARDAHDPGARVFRTGDLGREREDGLLEFLGRKDHQVKIRGHRVEPAEIEAALKTHPSVAEAAVIVRDDGSTGNATLAAYFEARKHVKVPPAGKSLASFLRSRLPAHMVPVEIMAIPRLPLLANFKIDRAQLARVDAMRATVSATTVPGTRNPDEPVAAAVRRVVAAVLDVKTVLPGDEMAALGADSLQLIQIALHLERQFGVELPADIYVPGLKVEDIVAGIERAREGRHA